MNRKQLDRLSPISLVAGTILCSVLASVIVYLVNRWLRSDSSDGGGSPPNTRLVGTASVPVIATVDPAVPETAPTHFTEALIIPGFTETGSQIEQDEGNGHSPGGV